MNIFKFFISLVFGLIFSCFFTQNVFAISSDVMITQMAFGNVSQKRLVEIYNNSDLPVDVTGWCLYHSSASEISNDTLACLTDENLALHYVLPARSYLLFGNDPLESETKMSFDFEIEKGLGSASGGHVFLKNSDVEIDRLGWGEATKPEGVAVPLGVDKVLQRQQDELGNYIDTDDNSMDFADSTIREVYQTGALMEVVDVCVNINGIQVLLPSGFEINEDEECAEAPAAGEYCIGECVEDEPKETPPLILNELLPNASGTDDGNEFIEIYNPNEEDVSLDDYSLQIGASFERNYDFSNGEIISAGSYRVFYNNQIRFTLLNASSGVRLIHGDETIDQIIYSNPPEGQSWALVDGIWQYTNRPTPNSANLSSVLAMKTTVDDNTLATCAEGYYRNPTTNRCNKIPVATTLEPCQEGYYRNPETNRCKKIKAEAVLEPCPEGQERNPETNRCRKIVQTSIPVAEYAPKETATQANNNWILWLSLGGVGLLAIGYAIWEWRREIVKLSARIISSFKKRE